MLQRNIQTNKYRYAGFFVSRNEVARAAETVAPGQRLEKMIKDPPVTLEYRPAYVDESLFGLQIKVHVVGYGNDGDNEGFKVELELPEDFPLAEQAARIPVPHITVSLAPGAAAVDTCTLPFETCKGFTFTAVYGAIDKENQKHLTAE